MLLNPTLEKLQALKLTGMSEALDEQLRSPDIDQLAFEERLGLMVDREITARDNRRLKTRASACKIAFTSENHANSMFYIQNDKF